MMAVLPTYDRRASAPRSSRDFPLAIAIGLAVGGIAACWSEWRAASAEPPVVRNVAPREFTGPSAAPMKVATGGNWLNAKTNMQAPLKAVEPIQASPPTGAGFSSARGGPGSAWGPVATGQDVAPPRAAWGDFNAPLMRNPIVRNAKAPAPYPAPVRAIMSDAAFTPKTDVARKLRFREQD